jgi:outer membrane protein assembly factor BamE
MSRHQLTASARISRRIIPVILTLTLTGCASDQVIGLLHQADLFYQPTIIQGDQVNAEKLSHLKPGMTRQQVRQLLGTPQLQDHFHAERWDYVYSLGTGSQPESIQHLTLYFEQEHLVRIAGDARNPATDNIRSGVIPLPHSSE